MVLRIEKYGNNTFYDVLKCGCEKNLWIDKLNALLVALLPLLQHYKGIYKNAGFTVLILVSVISLLRFSLYDRKIRFEKNCIMAILPLLFFQIYKMFDHTVSLSKLLYGFFMILVFVEAAFGTINTKLVVKYASVIGSVAAICLILQYISFYLFKKHIVMVPISFLLPSSDAWVLGAKTGLNGLRGIKTGFYRPSAFFLEPSHLFLYSFPILCLNLFLPNLNGWRKRTAILLTIGMLLSTSGMGIVTALLIWGVYLMLYRGSALFNRARLRNLFNAKNLLIALFFLIAIVAAYFFIPFFHNSVNRILGIGLTSTSAIDGRTRLARVLISTISGWNIIFGVTDSVEGINYNLSGFYSTVYKYGIIGIILSYWFYVQSVLKLKSAYFWISLIIIGISFFTAHTHGTFFMLYYILLLMSGYYERSILKR